MPKLVSDRAKAIFVEKMSQLRADIGRTVTVVYTPITINCPNCGYDPIKQISTGVYDPDDPYPNGVPGPTSFTRICPVCMGAGLYTTASSTDGVLCLISQLTRQEAEVTPLGKDFKRNYELQTALQYKSKFERAQSVIVDGFPCQVVAFEPGGIGELTQLLVYAGSNS